jgi:thioredoxin 1
MALAGVLLLALAAGWWTYQASAPDQPPPFDAAGAAAGDAVQRVLRQGKPTIVEFGSTSCVSCREMKPLLARLAREHGERVAVVDIDVLAEREYLRRYGIVVIPTQVFFDATGRETSRHVGKIELRDMLARLGASPPQDGP